MPFWVSCLMFGIPALLFILVVYMGIPFFESLGIPPLHSYLSALAVVLALMFAAALVAYAKIENRPMTWAAFRERYRYPKLTWKTFLLAIGMTLAAFVGYGLSSGISRYLIQIGIIPIPAGTPLMIRPSTDLSDIAVLNMVAGGSIAGRYELIPLYFVTLFFNIAGEELWWRGYTLPRQELTHGKWTWMIHGVMWTLFHAFKFWDWIGLLPVCLIISYVSQRSKNNWPAFLTHYMYNGVGFILISLAIFMPQ